MTVTHERISPTRTEPKGRWGFAHYLALASVPLLAYQAWTLVAWLASGPHQVTVGRDDSTISWWAARAIEVGTTTLAIALLVLAVRESRRLGRMPFDLKLWIALLITSFWDTFTNFIQPIWFYSSNFVNLNEWWGNAPGIISPAAGYGPYPVLALTMLYPCFVLESRIAAKLWGKVRTRHPDASPVRILAFGLTVSLAIGAVVSMVFVLPHLWAVPGMGVMILDTSSYRWSIAEFLYVGIWSTTVCALRVFVDERGEAITERGLEALSPRMRDVVSTAATTAWCVLAVILWSSLVTITGFYARPYPTGYPQHLSNVVCDLPNAPQPSTHYGPCPGSKGFEIPLRTSG